MKQRVKIVLLMILICAAFASAAFTMKPLIHNAEMIRQCRTETEKFYAEAEKVQEEQQAQPEEIPYADLYSNLQSYNELIYYNRQNALTSQVSYQLELFDLTQYGLPDQVFGVIKIPKMELEMPLYLGASDENMANGAAVLTQTSVPIGGVNTNCVIAGHRGWNG